MPHVASQVVDKKPSHECWTKKQAMSIIQKSSEFQRPATAAQRQKRPLNPEMPSLSLLVTSPNNLVDIVPVRHARKVSEFTPISAVDTLFEISSAASYEQTPNSSMHSFAVELEDTSPNPFATRHTNSELPKSPEISVKSLGSSAHSHQNLGPSSTEPHTPARSLRSSKTRTYLSPAVTNAEIHLDLPGSSGVRSSRSQSAPQPISTIPVTTPAPHDQPLPLPMPHLNSPANIKSRAAIVIEAMTAIEEDNRQLLERALAAEEAAKTLQEVNIALQQRIAYCYQHHRPQTAPGRTRRAASESTPISTFNITPARLRQPPLNLTPTNTISGITRGSPTRSRRQARPQASISGPIPGSVIRQQITYKGTPISHIPPVATISLAEARRREKPLPFITPMSPSMVPGYVEMGGKAEFCAEERMGLRKKKTFGDLFWWGRRMGGLKA